MARLKRRKNRFSCISNKELINQILGCLERLSTASKKDHVNLFLPGLTKGYRSIKILDMLGSCIRYKDRGKIYKDKIKNIRFVNESKLLKFRELWREYFRRLNKSLLSEEDISKVIK